MICCNIKALLAIVLVFSSYDTANGMICCNETKLPYEEGEQLVTIPEKVGVRQLMTYQKGI